MSVAGPRSQAHHSSYSRYSEHQSHASCASRHEDERSVAPSDSISQVSSRHSRREESPPPKSQASHKAPSVAPEDSVSQMGSRAHKSRYSSKRSEAADSHHSRASGSSSHAGSRLTAENLHAHDEERHVGGGESAHKAIHVAEHRSIRAGEHGSQHMSERRSVHVSEHQSQHGSARGSAHELEHRSVHESEHASRHESEHASRAGTERSIRSSQRGRLLEVEDARSTRGGSHHSRSRTPESRASTAKPARNSAAGSQAGSKAGSKAASEHFSVREESEDVTRSRAGSRVSIREDEIAVHKAGSRVSVREEEEEVEESRSQAGSQASKASRSYVSSKSSAAAASYAEEKIEIEERTESSSHEHSNPHYRTIMLTPGSLPFRDRSADRRREIEFVTRSPIDRKPILVRERGPRIDRQPQFVTQRSSPAHIEERRPNRSPLAYVEERKPYLVRARSSPVYVERSSRENVDYRATEMEERSLRSSRNDFDRSVGEDEYTIEVEMDAEQYDDAPYRVHRKHMYHCHE